METHQWLPVCVLCSNQLCGLFHINQDLVCEATHAEDTCHSDEVISLIMMIPLNSCSSKFLAGYHFHLGNC